MSIRCEDHDGVCVATVGGDLSGESAAALLKAVGERIEQRQIVDFVIDFESSGFADSAGLEAMLAAKNRCEELLGQLKLANLDENMRKILEITRLEHRFDAAETLIEALRGMR
jgi:anti-anti-sigma factor